MGSHQPLGPDSPSGQGEALPVVAAVLRRGDAVLVQRRPKGSHLEGLWEFPGGKIEKGESPEAALIRELREEIGIRARVLRLLRHVTHTYPERRISISFYLCDLERGSVLPERPSLRWMSPEELLKGLSPPANAELLRLLREEGPGK